MPGRLQIGSKFELPAKGKKAIQHVFILGCERSGSTWIANIFDAHPQVEFFMEPFADFAGLFPGFPERNLYLSHGSAGLVNLVKEGHKALHRAKYPLFYKPNKPLYLKWLDRYLINHYQTCARLLRVRVSSKIKQYRLLNLNTFQIPFGEQSRKKKNQSVEVIKELRLNFKVNLLAKAFPDAKYFIAIRHPGAQVSSVKRLFRQGHLGELSRSLPSFVDCVKDHKRFRSYWDTIDELNWENDLEIKLILWWLINYQVLIEDVQLNKLDYQIVGHEEISEKPCEVARRFLEFCGLSLDKSVKQYLHHSSQTKTKNFSPVDTNRDSGQYYKEMIASVDSTTNKKIQKIVSCLSKSTSLEPHLLNYLKGFYTFQ